MAPFTRTLGAGFVAFFLWPGRCRLKPGAIAGPRIANHQAIAMCLIGFVPASSSMLSWRENIRNPTCRYSA